MVGSRDERPDHTGLAHLFEHLMFGGSKNIPEFDVPLQEAGGLSNAWTSNDFTSFHEILPAHNIETALWLESDRMLSLGFSDKALEVQRSVVVEEFKQVCLNRPYGDSPHRLYAMAYPDGGPYHTPVIGRNFADIEKTTQDDVKRWFFEHYAPNNAILTVVGNIEPERLQKLVEKWYGDIPRREVAPRSVFTGYNSPATEFADLPFQSLPQCPPPPQTALTMAFQMPACTESGYAEADLITDILANGKASRFYRRLLMPGKIFTSIDASVTGFELPGLLLISAKLINNGASAEQVAIEAINQELKELAEHAVSADELSRVLNRYESNRLFNNLSPLQKAQALAANLHYGESEEEIIERYRNVTPESLRAVAEKIFAKSPFTLIVRP